MQSVRPVSAKALQGPGLGGGRRAGQRILDPEGRWERGRARSLRPHWPAPLSHWDVGGFRAGKDPVSSSEDPSGRWVGNGLWGWSRGRGRRLVK